MLERERGDVERERGVVEQERGVVERGRGGFTVRNGSGLEGGRRSGRVRNGRV